LGNGDPPLCNPFYGAQRGLVAQGEDGRRLLRTEQRLDGPVSVFSGATLAFVRYLQKMSERRRVLPEYDLMSALVQAEEGGGRLSQDELLAMSFLLLVAGHQATANLFASGTLALLEHPDQLEKLNGDTLTSSSRRSRSY